MGISIICGKDIIAYICLAMVIIIVIVCILAYFIIFNKDPDLLHDEQHILEREMIKYINKEKSNKSEPSNYNEFNKY